MAGYFGFKIAFVQNVTDVDDKIILRARQQHLFSQFKQKNPKVTQETVDVTQQAFNAYVRKNLPLLSEGLKPEDFNAESAEKYRTVMSGKSLDGVSAPGDKEAKVKMHLATAGKAATALLSPSKSTEIDTAEFYESASDVLYPYLDTLYGSEIDANDHSIVSLLLVLTANILTPRFVVHSIDQTI
jgi:cysteinyl-tRNA synthetase